MCGFEMADDIFTLVSAKEAKQFGLRFYFTGKPCKRGHIVKRRVRSLGCTECENYRSREGRKANPHSYREKGERWRLKNLESYRAGRRKWNRENKDKIKAAAERRRLKRIAELERLGLRPPKDTTTPLQLANRAYMRKWKAANRDRLRVHHQNRRARKRGSNGTHTLDDIFAIIKSQKGKCCYCRLKLTSAYHIDHIVPLSKGGRNDRRNIQIACGFCNGSKKDKDPIVFAQSLGMLL